MAVVRFDVNSRRCRRARPDPQLAAPAGRARRRREEPAVMTRWLRDAPIRQKLIALGLIASACALLVASAVFLVATYLGARRDTRAAVLVQAAITTDNIGGPALGDRSAATDTLRLRALPIVDLACVGQPWAVFRGVSTRAHAALPRAAAGCDRARQHRRLRGRRPGRGRRTRRRDALHPRQFLERHGTSCERRPTRP